MQFDSHPLLSRIQHNLKLSKAVESYRPRLFCATNDMLQTLQNEFLPQNIQLEQRKGLALTSLFYNTLQNFGKENRVYTGKNNRKGEACIAALDVLL